MRQQWNRWLVGFILVMPLSLSTAARTITTYYTCLPGTVTAVVLTNASAYEHEEAFTLTMYDAGGSVAHTSTGGLDSYQSMVYFLNDFVDEPNEFSWGSLIIESSILLQAGLWLGTETDWVSVSNLQAQSLSTEGLDIVYYWYGASYANTENRRAGIGLINPSDSTVMGTAYIYDSAGSLQNSSAFTLLPHGASYFNPESVFPIGKDSWGLIDIRATAPIVVACEYFDADRTLLDVDVIDTVYFLQVQQEDSEDS
ncbi:hypothetical protein KAR02_04045 [Candidatus Bipolaricaulota bacterium]|nr:hypothetical protein [Candidatus Bipolaricaulota bacterium]